MSNQLKIATIISRIFDPFISLLVLIILALRISTLSGFEQIRFFTLALLTMIGIPVVLLLWAVKKKYIRDWDMNERNQRPITFLILFVIEVTSILFLRSYMDAFLFRLCIDIMIWLVGFSAITLFWKISGHAGVTALATGLIVSWYGWWTWWPLLIVIPVVSWARVVRKNHTVAQVIAGAAYSLVLIFIVRVFFGY